MDSPVAPQLKTDRELSNGPSAPDMASPGQSKGENNLHFPAGHILPNATTLVACGQPVVNHWSTIGQLLFSHCSTADQLLVNKDT